MDFLEDALLETKSGEMVPAKEALEDTTLVAFYFGAGWCPPCKTFAASLSNIYQEAKESEITLEVIFISSDETPEDRMEFYQSHPSDWLSLPWEAESLALDLREHFGVTNIPTVIVVVRETGRVITTTGMEEIELGNTDVLERWIELYDSPPSSRNSLDEVYYEISGDSDVSGS